MSDSKIPTPPVPKKPIPPPPKRVTKSTVVTMEKGRMPPSAIDLEEVVLGACLIDRNAYHQIAEILREEMFFKEQHYIIFKAIKTVSENNIGIDLLTVSEELKRTDKLLIAGGDYYLIQLTQKVASAIHIEFHSRIIIQKYVLRELIRISENTIRDSYDSDPDIFDLLENVENEISSIYKHSIKSENGQNESALDELEKRRQLVLQGIKLGIPIGLYEFDDWCGGFHNRELVTIAARPSMGKTAVGIAISCTAVFKHNIPTAFFSLETSKIDISNKSAARLSKVNYTKIKNATFTDEEYSKVKQALKYIEESRFEIYDTYFHKNNLNRIVKKIRELVSQGVRLVVIDYVQLIKLTNGFSKNGRTEELNEITRTLKALANELNIPIVELAQLSRSVDTRPGHRPILADLKQSGSIEEDSDTVIFLLREAYYQFIENPKLELPAHIIGKINFIIAKGRNTGLNEFIGYLDLKYFDFMSYSDADF